uniref:Formyl peptide receptor 3 n=1 Tax=Nothobranchius korthausae TaxID=1143690 RepID=A0A1A8FHF3_9TELE
MFSNSSLPPAVIENSKDDQTKVDVKAVMEKISIVIYTMTVVFGLTGNSLVIWVAGFKLKRKVTNVWLVNLAIADLIFCITRVFSLTKKLFFDHWPFGVFLCKFNSFFKYANMFCSVFLLAIISLDRMLCVCRPVLTKRHRTLCAARVVALLIWITSILFSSPFFIHRQVYKENNETKCSLKVKEEDVTIKYALYIIRFLCGFVFPFVVILICYVVAGIGIRRTRLSGKSRPLRILASLVIAFFLCWAPYHCLQLVKMVDSKNAVLKVWQPLASSLAYFNSCVNPLLYFCMGIGIGGRFKQSVMTIYRKALADDGEGQTSQSNERSLEESVASKHNLSVVANPAVVSEGSL